SAETLRILRRPLGADLVHARAVRREDHAAERQALALDARVAGDRRAAGAVENGEERAFAGERPRSRTMIDRAEHGVRPPVADAAFDADGALPRRRRKGLERQQLGDDAGKAEPAQAGMGEKRARHLPLL